MGKCYHRRTSVIKDACDLNQLRSGSAPYHLYEEDKRKREPSQDKPSSLEKKADKHPLLRKISDYLRRCYEDVMLSCPYPE